MLNFSVLKTKVKISPLLFVVLTLFFLADRKGIALPVVFFSLCHEAAHFLVLFWEKVSPQSVSLCMTGIRVVLSDHVETGKKIKVFIAGFSINFFFAALFCFLEKKTWSVINLCLGCFTFLPLPSTDGGAVLKLLFPCSISRQIGKISGVFSLFCLLLLLWKTNSISLCLPIFYLFFAILSY